MKKKLKYTMLLMIVTLLSMGLAAPAFAGSANKPPTCVKDCGWHNSYQITGDVKGTKLEGPIHIRLHSMGEDGYYTAMDVAVRLSQGNNMEAFGATITGLHLGEKDYGTAQQVLVDALGGAIISRFASAYGTFPVGSCYVNDDGCSGPNALDIYLKAVNNDVQHADEINGVDSHIVADLILAVD